MLKEQLLTLDQYEALARRRRATRHFLPDAIPAEMLERLIEIARWSPSGYNLQPTHIVIVTDEAKKRALHQACMMQAQILEAPAILILTGDRQAAENNFEKMLAMELAAGSIDKNYERLLRRIVPLSFSHAPLGFGWLWKALLPPLVRLVRPVPKIPAVYKRDWLIKQVMLVAMNLMLAATAAGLATVPMEGFDEQRVRRILQIPRSQVIPVIIPIGYAQPRELTKTRLPGEQFIHHNGW